MIVIIMVAVLLGMLLPGSKAPGRAQRIACVNNLKQVGLAFHLWANDHEEMFPLQVSTNAGGTREFLKGPNVFLHFQIMTNELVTPKILFCPAESDSTRCMADTFSKPVSNRDKWRIPFTGNTNVSYFVGVDSVTTNGEMFLSGDHNITNGTPIKNGFPFRVARMSA